VDGWLLYAERVHLNGGSTVAGYPTPDDVNIATDQNGDETICPLDDCVITGDFTVDITGNDPPPSGSDSSALLASSLGSADCVRTTEKFCWCSVESLTHFVCLFSYFLPPIFLF